MDTDTSGSDPYTNLLACQRYIELNPVRAGMAAHPVEYRWSSFRANAQGETDPMVQPHAMYEALRLDAASRQAAYRELFRYDLDRGVIDEIRRATNGNYALGHPQFAAQIAAAVGRRAATGNRGGLERYGRPNRRVCSKNEGAANRHSGPSPNVLDALSATRQRYALAIWVTAVAAAPLKLIVFSRQVHPL